MVGCWTFDEDGGTSVGDCSGNDSVGMLGGAATWTPGKMNSAISFGGNAADMVVVAASNVLDFGTGSFSYGLWVKLDPSLGTGFELPMWKGGSSAFYAGYDLEYSETGMTWDVSLSDGVTVLPLHSDVHDYRDSTWHHLFAVIDRSTATESLYIDGALATGPSSIASLGSVSSTNALEFDGRGTDPLLGAVDEARIYDRALSTAEIGVLYASPGAR